jgi:Caspase domain
MKTILKFLSALLLFFAMSHSAWSQKKPNLTAESEAVSAVFNFDIGISNVDNIDLDFDISEITKQGKYYALIIGVADYKDAKIKDLDYPVKDANNLKRTLTELYAFESENTYILENPTQKQIIERLDELSKKVSANDNLLIFYAGHGKWDEKLQVGYWLPQDADINNKSTWFSNSLLKDYVKGIESKHTLLIADACFSGGIFKTRSLLNFTGAPDEIKKLYNEKSRKAITSGSLSEVPDNSIFMESMVRELRKNKDVFLPAGVLFYNFRGTVLSFSSHNQLPQYQVVEGTKDEGGEFIFVRKK